jgi:hypothetical protein
MRGHAPSQGVRSGISTDSMLKTVQIFTMLLCILMFMLQAYQSYAAYASHDFVQTMSDGWPLFGSDYPATLIAYQTPPCQQWVDCGLRVYTNEADYPACRKRKGDYPALWTPQCGVHRLRSDGVSKKEGDTQLVRVNSLTIFTLPSLRLVSLRLHQ